MKKHQDIDERSLALARAIVAKIDEDPSREGLRHARQTCAQWFQENPAPAISEWLAILQGDWADVRVALLDEGQHGQRLRQSNPFCGVLTAQERWEIFRRFVHEHTAA